MSQAPQGKQVSLKVFDNEPTARMAEQLLNLEDIPCLVRCLRGGPGIWGTTFNLPHDLLVYEENEMQAREILEIPPQEILEREQVQGGFEDYGSEQTPSRPLPQWIVTATIVGLVAFVALTVVIVDRAIR